jgi:hypothetical protein
MINKAEFTPYLKESRIQMLSKTSAPTTTLGNCRPIAINSQITRAIEKVLKEKLEELGMVKIHQY